MNIAIELDADRIATAERWVQDDGVGGTAPADAVARFERFVDAVMHVTGRDRSWARIAAAETWPGEVPPPV